MGERKLVEAFRTFFEKTVSPHVSQNQEVMREWNQLNKMFSTDPIDYSQIQFYLLLSNKSASLTPGKGSQQNIGSFNKIPDNDPSSKFRQSDFNLIRYQDKKATQPGYKKQEFIHLEKICLPVQRRFRSNQCKIKKNQRIWVDGISNLQGFRLMGVRLEGFDMNAAVRNFLSLYSNHTINNRTDKSKHKIKICFSSAPSEG